MVCLGSEKNFYDCRYWGWGKYDCMYGWDVSVKCIYGFFIIWLVGGFYNYGCVEVLVGGWWGIICDCKWDINDVKVVCC